MEKREKFSKIIFVIFLIFTIWALLLVIAPMMLSSGSTGDLSGSVGVSDKEEVFDDMPTPWKNIYSCGDGLCHQKSERSFFLNENQMPFCSRCIAIFVGIAIGIGIMIFYKIELDEKLIFIIIIGMAPLAVDGVGQLFEFWTSNNLIRVITGISAGVVSGFAIGILIDEVKTLKSI